MEMWLCGTSYLPDLEHWWYPLCPLIRTSADQPACHSVLSAAPSSLILCSLSLLTGNTCRTGSPRRSIYNGALCRHHLARLRYSHDETPSLTGTRSKGGKGRLSQKRQRKHQVRVQIIFIPFICFTSSLSVCCRLILNFFIIIALWMFFQVTVLMLTSCVI